MLGKIKITVFAILMALSGLLYYLAITNMAFFVWAIVLEVAAVIFFILYAITIGNARKVNKMVKSLSQFVGEMEISVKDYEKKLYSRDSAPLPGIVMMLFKTTPDVIIKTADVSALAQVLIYARAKKIPVTLAAGKTSMMAGTVPLTGGIVLDLMENEGIVDLDEDNLLVTVKAGTVWKPLLEELEWKGYTLALYPSSSPAATVGGFISTGGIGIGGMKGGGICDQVIDLKILGLDGKTYHTNPSKIGTRVGYNLNMLGLGTEGTLGMVLEATLRVYPKPEKRSYHTITFKSHEDMTGFIDDVVQSDLTPMHMEWKDKNFVELMRALEFEFKPGESLVFMALDGSETVVNAEIAVMNKMMARWHGHDHGYDKSMQEWNDRFYPMRVKRLGPNIMGGEVLIPSKNISAALNDFEKVAASLQTIHGVEGAMGARSSTTSLCDVLVDERKFFSYLFSVGAIIDVVDIGFKYGGRNYTFNAWNSFYMNRVFNKPHRDINTRLKEHFDERRVLQQFKTVDTPRTQLLGLKFRPFMFTAVLNLIKIFNRYKLIGGLLAVIGGLITVLALVLPQGFFTGIVGGILGTDTTVGIIEPMMDVGGILESLGLSGLLYGILGVLDYRIFGILSWLVFVGIILVFVGVRIGTKSTNNALLASWIFIGIAIVVVALQL